MRQSEPTEAPRASTVGASSWPCRSANSGRPTPVERFVGAWPAVSAWSGIWAFKMLRNALPGLLGFSGCDHRFILFAGRAAGRFVDHEPVLVFEVFEALIVSSETLQPVREDLVYVVIHPLEKLEDVFQQDLRVDVASPVFELDHADPAVFEQRSAALEDLQLVTLHVDFQKIDSPDLPLGAVILQGVQFRRLRFLRRFQPPAVFQSLPLVERMQARGGPEDEERPLPFFRTETERVARHVRRGHIPGEMVEIVP